MRSSDHVYNTVKAITAELADKLTQSILSRVVQRLALEGSITLDAFLSENNLKRNTEEYHVLLSEHYREEIFKATRAALHLYGYEARLEFDDESRLKSIYYDVRPMNPVKRLLRYAAFLSLPILVGAGSLWFSRTERQYN